MVKIYELDSGYIVSNDAGDELVLSEDDILTLAQSARLLRDQLLARRTRGAKATARPAAPVSEVVLNVDLHKTVLYLLMIDPKGVEAGFALPLNVAKQLAEKLPGRVAEIETAEANREIQ